MVNTYLGNPLLLQHLLPYSSSSGSMIALAAL
jgi:hypothetical protein